MRRTIVSVLLLSAIAAQVYPVEGRWGQSTSTEKGAIDCAGIRVIEFNGDQRTDSNGGVPAYRNQSVISEGRRTTGSLMSSRLDRSAPGTRLTHCERSIPTTSK
jgi:hypothetical protein